jgi:alpha-1,3-rhamnosyl/mannosyltransferase
VYDLLLLSKRTDFPWYKRAYHRWAYRRVAARAAHIVTISEFCRREIVERLGVAPEQVSVAPPGLDHEFDKRSVEARERLALPARYLLAVAGAYPHKRLLILLDVLAMLADDMPDLQLVIAGTYAGDQKVVTALLTGVRSRGLSARVHFLRRLARSDMSEVFAGAAALVSASEFEGFGIPVIEAMAVGCPVAASPAEAVVVVMGGCGWVATDFSAAALAEVVRSALSARQHAAERLSAAASRVRTRYTWPAAAAAVEGALRSR